MCSPGKPHRGRHIHGSFVMFWCPGKGVNIVANGMGRPGSPSQKCDYAVWISLSSQVYRVAPNRQVDKSSRTLIEAIVIKSLWNQAQLGPQCGPAVSCTYQGPDRRCCLHDMDETLKHRSERTASKPGCPIQLPKISRQTLKPTTDPLG